MLNPIISDTKKARPAGKIFERDGKVYRPSQLCTSSYGYGIDINEIVHLSETEYEEKRVASIRPDWDDKIIATHTYNETDSLTVLDAYTRRLEII